LIFLYENQNNLMIKLKLNKNETNLHKIKHASSSSSSYIASFSDIPKKKSQRNVDAKRSTTNRYLKII